MAPSLANLVASGSAIMIKHSSTTFMTATCYDSISDDNQPTVLANGSCGQWKTEYVSGARSEYSGAIFDDPSNVRIGAMLAIFFVSLSGRW